MRIGAVFASGGHLAALALFFIIAFVTGLGEATHTGFEAQWELWANHDVAVLMLGLTVGSLFLEAAGDAVSRSKALTWFRSSFATIATLTALWFVLEWLTKMYPFGNLELLLSLAVAGLMGGDLWRTLQARAEHVAQS